MFGEIVSEMDKEKESLSHNMEDVNISKTNSLVAVDTSTVKRDGTSLSQAIRSIGCINDNTVTVNFNITNSNSQRSSIFHFGAVI